MEELSNLPPLAIIAFGAVLALIFAARYLGLWQIAKSASGSQSTAQVAAVIVDPTALNHASAAVEGLTVAVTEATKVGREHAKNMERMAEEMNKVREEMRIQREVNRGR